MAVTSTTLLLSEGRRLTSRRQPVTSIRPKVKLALVDAASDGCVRKHSGLPEHASNGTVIFGWRLFGNVIADDIWA
jgi:hypothetical protein